MKNVPVIKIGIVAVSRDCFPESLAVNRRKAVIAEYEKKFGKDGIYECPITIVESEIHAQQALEDVKKAGRRSWRCLLRYAERQPGSLSAQDSRLHS